MKRTVVINDITHDEDVVHEQLSLGEELAEYLIDSREEQDFQEWRCGEVEDGDLPSKCGGYCYTLDERHMNHIFCKAKLFLHHAGHDISPYQFTSEFLGIKESTT